MFAHGSRFGGHALFIKDHKLHYVYNFLGIPPEQHFMSNGNGLAPGKHVLGRRVLRRRGRASIGESHGTTKLYVDDEVVAQGPMRTMTGHFSLCGEGLSVGKDGGDAVSHDYGSQFAFKDGKIYKVEFDVGDDAYVDIERELAAAMARD